MKDLSRIKPWMARYFGVGFCLVLLVGNAAADTPNLVSIHNPHPQMLTAFPVSFGMVFQEGDIPQFPAAVVTQQGLPTQADVKTRWPDGSVQHAILAFELPQISANGRIQIAFRNQPTGNNGNALTPPEILADFPNFRCENSSLSPRSIEWRLTG